MAETSSKTGDSSKDKKGDQLAFEPRKGKVIEHTKYGVWDLYQERDKYLSYLPTCFKVDAYTEMWNDLPYLWRAIRDLFSVAWLLLTLYMILTLATALLPALILWCVRLLLS
jgi:ABC-type sugar transport system permease subunit